MDNLNVNTWIKASVFSLLLVGCTQGTSNTEKDFLCSAQDGKACSSISEADGSHGGNVRSVREKPSDTFNKEISQDPLFSKKGKKSIRGGGDVFGDGGVAYTPVSYRKKEKLGTLWIAPYRDDDDVLHEASFVHFVIKSAGWE